MDYSLNEDKICRPFPDGPQYGADTYVPGSLRRVVTATEEPITLAEAKHNMRIAYSTPEEDALILRHIKAARTWCEERAGQSIVSTDISVTIQLVQNLELPYGPVPDTNTISGIDPQYVAKGDFPSVYGTVGRFDITYKAGYETAPEWAKNAILARVAATYENRGDQDKTNYSKIALSEIAPHKRVTAWV